MPSLHQVGQVLEWWILYPGVQTTHLTNLTTLEPYIIIPHIDTSFIILRCVSTQKGAGWELVVRMTQTHCSDSGFICQNDWQKLWQSSRCYLQLPILVSMCIFRESFGASDVWQYYVSNGVTFLLLADWFHQFRSWWRQDKETLNGLLAFCEGKPTVTGRSSSHNIK